jgi:hypothetical protein|tara:strand:+ start:350 stop:538 length:189 start_codon:yes stop_codon:yes gene_type:complete
MVLVNIDELSYDIKWEVEQLQETVDYHIGCLRLVKSPEVRYELEIKIKNLKNKIRKVVGDNE